MIHKGIKTGGIVLLLAMALGGCTALREIGDAFRDDPLEAALVVSKTNLDTITAFRAEGCTPVPDPGIELPCHYVEIIDASYTTAHNAAVDAATRIYDDPDFTDIDKIIEALRGVSEAITIAATIDDNPDRVGNIYLPARLGIAILIQRIEEAVKK